MTVRKQHPPDVRKRVCLHYHRLGGSIRHIGRVYNVPKSTVHRYISQYRNGLNIKERKRNSKVPVKDVMAFVSAEFKNNMFTRLEDLVRGIEKRFGARYSRSAVGKIVKKDGQFVKRRVYPTSPYAHDNVVVRDACMKIIQNQENIVCIDETCIYVGNHSTRGWGKRGQRLRLLVEKIRPVKISLITAICQNGVVGYDVTDGNYNSAKFSKFIKTLSAPEGSILLMDNVQFHRSECVVKAIEEKSFSQFFIPPYSPKLNAIELFFANIKSTCRKEGLHIKDKHEYAMFVSNVVSIIDADTCMRYFEHVTSICLVTIALIDSNPSFVFSGYD